MGDTSRSTEDQVSAFMQQRCAEELATWRSLSGKNAGVDGLIEMERRDGASLYVAAQVRSGQSYFRDARGGRVALNLGSRLRYLNSLLVPCIVVAHDPERDQGYWRSVKSWCADHPESLVGGRIELDLGSVLDPAAFHALRSEARVVLTPKLDREEIRAFLEINRDIDHAAFVLLARHVLARSDVESRGTRPELLPLRHRGLFSYREDSHGGTGYWRPTLKGERYIQFMLGDRYTPPSELLQPRGPISEDDVDRCLDFEAQLASARRDEGEG